MENMEIKIIGNINCEEQFDMQRVILENAIDTMVSLEIKNIPTIIVNMLTSETPNFNLDKFELTNLYYFNDIKTLNSKIMQMMAYFVSLDLQNERQRLLAKYIEELYLSLYDLNLIDVRLLIDDNKKFKKNKSRN